MTDSTIIRYLRDKLPIVNEKREVVYDHRIETLPQAMAWVGLVIYGGSEMNIDLALRFTTFHQVGSLLTILKQKDKYIDSHLSDCTDTVQTYLTSLSSYSKHLRAFEQNLELRYLAKKALDGSFDQEEYAMRTSGETAVSSTESELA